MKQARDSRIDPIVFHDVFGQEENPLAPWVKITDAYLQSHFPDAQCLAVTLIRVQRERSKQRVADILANADYPALERIRAALKTIMELALRSESGDCSRPQRNFSESAKAGTVIRDAFQTGHAAFHDCLVRGQKDGSIRSDITSDAAVRHLSSTLHHALVVATAYRDLSPVDVAVRLCVDRFLAKSRPRTVAPGLTL